MLAAKNGHKDVVFILTQKGANLDLVNRVSVHVDMLYEKIVINEDKMYLLFPKTCVSCLTITLEVEILSFNYMRNMMTI